VPIEKTLDPSRRFVRLDYGPQAPTPQETLEAISSVLSDSRLPPDIGILINARALAEPPSPERVRRMVTAFAEQTTRLRDRRFAVVYAGGSATFGMLRMAQLLASELPSTLAMFETLEEAEAWLKR
jgi:hypothetical protein